MRRTLIHIAVFLCLGFSAVAINSPEIRCVNVQPNGTVILSWQPPSDPNNEFKSYEVWSSAGLNGPWSLDGSVPVYNQTSYSSSTYNANTAPYFFFVRVKNTSNIESPAIDTVKTIFLNLTSAPNSGVASFSWNDFHFPLPAGEASVYKVFKESPIGTWTQIASKTVKTTLPNYTYNDTITACSDSINYRVELFDPIISCTSVSNIKGANFIDKNAPAAPLLDSVSVNYGGQSVLGIHPSYSSDVKCYVILKWDPTVGTTGTWIKIDTICNNNMPFVYTDPNSNPGTSSVEYSLAALDNCNNLGIIASNTQSTIYLHSTYDICKRAASLTWNSYKNMAGGVNHYEILCSVNGGAYAHIADTTATVYLHKGLIQGSNYCYLVRAHSNLKTLALKDSITSSSNKYCINPSSANTPLYVYLNDVSVIAPANEIEVKWYIDKNVRVGGFTIYRADTYSGPYAYAGSTNYTAQSNYTFINDNVNINSQKYYYYVMVLDTCLNPIMHTDSSHTILLQAAATGNFKATLTWNDYGKWLGNVSGFNIYRSLDGVFSGGPIATVPAGTFSYEDDLSNYTTYNGKFTYYVEAIEGAGDQYGFTEKSESNYADVYIDASMYVPNAFVPKGHNKIFLPIGDYIEKTDYKFSIFDRWGVKIFETTNETEGWDGGHYEEGIYAYHIEYKTALGEYRQQKGTVMMIR